MTTITPQWLLCMRSMDGLTEEPGSADNPKILAMRDAIAAAYPDMEGYCATYQHDATAWCFDGSVEILTERGFVRLDALTDERVYQVDIGFHLTLTSDVVKIVKDYDGDVFDINHRHIKLTCDVGHRWFGYWGSHRSRFGPGTLERLEHDNETLEVPAVSSGATGHALTDDQLRLIAAFISDGSYRYANDRKAGDPWSINFEVSKQRKIAALMALCPAHVYTQKRAYGPLTKVPLTAIRFVFPAWFHEVFSDYKTLSRAFINGLSKEQARAFIQSYSLFDGNGKTILYTSDKQRCDDLVTILLMAGYHPAIYKRQDGSCLTKKEAWKISWAAGKRCRTLKRKDISRRSFKGKLYCVSVPEGKIVVRGSNGNPITTGNCGLAAAYAMTMAGIRPVFGFADTDKWLWAQAWTDPDWGFALDEPVLGCVVVFTREGGGHVAFYERTNGDCYVCHGGNQSDAVNEKSFPISDVIGLYWPAQAGPVPAAPPPTLEQGDTGPDVEYLQGVLGLPVDGEFGPVTKSGVQGFQTAVGLTPDGIVGPQTWVKVDGLYRRVQRGDDGIPADLKSYIADMAVMSPIQSYDWVDRGRSPLGYISGMGQAYALALTWLQAGSAAAHEMAQPVGNPDTDALAWYAPEFAALGLGNPRATNEVLRALFMLMIGLGMRESSGVYCEGRDMSASNVASDTAEAGLFQASWNISTASPNILPLLEQYALDPTGFLTTFAQELEPSASDLDNYGSGQGALYQFLAKYSPAFAVMVAAIGLRTRRQHWGPINRKEVELVMAAHDFLLDVEAAYDGQPTPEPEPEPEPATVDITTTGNVEVTVNGQPCRTR